MDTDLLRQRRNLIVISSGLLLFDFAKVTVTKISIMGTELLIGDAQVIVYFAWAMWGYFLLRYYQYLKVEVDLGISSSVKKRFEGWARAYVFRNVLNDTKFFQGHIQFARKGLRWSFSIIEYDPAKLGEIETRNNLLPFVGTLLWWGRSLFSVAMHTPKATDHVLPFLLAIAAPVISIFRAVQA